MDFEFIFDDTSYGSMTELTLGPRSDGYVRPRRWRSIDLGQTYTVGIQEDPVKELTVLTISKRGEVPLSASEIGQVLDHFYPHRVATRQDSSGQGSSVKFAIWPGEEDLKLPWYRQQLVGKPE